DVYVFHIGPARRDGQHEVSHFLVPHTGWVVGRIPGDEAHLLFQIENSRHEFPVFRIRIDGDDAATSFQFANADRLNRGYEKAVAWFTDGAGELRGAIARKGNEWMVLYGAKGHLEPVIARSEFRPLALSGDGRLFYGLSDRQRGQIELVSFDPATRTFATVY